MLMEEVDQEFLIGKCPVCSCSNAWHEGKEGRAQGIEGRSEAEFLNARINEHRISARFRTQHNDATKNRHTIVTNYTITQEFEFPILERMWLREFGILTSERSLRLDQRLVCLSGAHCSGRALAAFSVATQGPL